MRFITQKKPILIPVQIRSNINKINTNSSEYINIKMFYFHAYL